MVDKKTMSLLKKRKKTAKNLFFVNTNGTLTSCVLMPTKRAKGNVGEGEKGKKAFKWT